MILCIDSMIIVWGIKKSATAGQESMIQQAEYFFEWADKHDHEIIIPTVVLAEIMAPETPEKREQYLHIIEDAFLIKNFDIRASLKYAQMLHGRFEEVKNAASEQGVTRQRMKIDHIIIATAMVNNAHAIVSYDAPLKKFAEGFINVIQFPQRPAAVVDLFSGLASEPISRPAVELANKVVATAVEPENGINDENADHAPETS
jgi:predicted nucleic acid-binding protein